MSSVNGRNGLGQTFGRMCREARLTLDVPQQRLASRVGVTRSYIGRIERGAANPSIKVIDDIAAALGIELELVARHPVVHDRPRPRDSVHARCSMYVDRRLRAHGLVVAREVEVVHGRSHGWIDLLAFDARNGTLLVIEVKTRLDDLGAIERQVSWYERSAWPVARDLGWSPRAMRSWLIVLASEEVEQMLRANRDLFDRSFPARADEMMLDLGGAGIPAGARRGLAMVDPASRRRRWLIKTRADGRRSPARYRDYADAARR